MAGDPIFRVPNVNGLYTIKESSRRFCMRHLAMIASLAASLLAGWLAEARDEL
jgi:hypothetical protein